MRIHAKTIYDSSRSGAVIGARCFGAASRTLLFGSLAFAGHPGLRSMGLLAILGCVCCLIEALVTLPAILALWAGGHAGEPQRAPASEDPEA